MNGDKIPHKLTRIMRQYVQSEVEPQWSATLPYPSTRLRCPDLCNIAVESFIGACVCDTNMYSFNGRKLFIMYVHSMYAICHLNYNTVTFISYSLRTPQKLPSSYRNFRVLCCSAITRISHTYSLSAVFSSAPVTHEWNTTLPRIALFLWILCYIPCLCVFTHAPCIELLPVTVKRVPPPSIFILIVPA